MKKTFYLGSRRGHYRTFYAEKIGWKCLCFPRWHRFAICAPVSSGIGVQPYPFNRSALIAGSDSEISEGLYLATAGEMPLSRTIRAGFNSHPNARLFRHFPKTHRPLLICLFSAIFIPRMSGSRKRDSKRRAAIPEFQKLNSKL